MNVSDKQQTWHESNIFSFSNNPGILDFTATALETKLSLIFPFGIHSSHFQPWIMGGDFQLFAPETKNWDSTRKLRSMVRIGGFFSETYQHKWGKNWFHLQPPGVVSYNPLFFKRGRFCWPTYNAPRYGNASRSSLIIFPSPLRYDENSSHSSDPLGVLGEVDWYGCLGAWWSGCWNVLQDLPKLMRERNTRKKYEKMDLRI